MQRHQKFAENGMLLLYTGYDEHKSTNLHGVLALQAQIWYGGVPERKKLFEFFYTVQCYKTLVEFYLYAVYKWSKSCARTFWRDREKISFLRILAKIMEPSNNLVQNNRNTLKYIFFSKNASNLVKIDQKMAKQ